MQRGSLMNEKNFAEAAAKMVTDAFALKCDLSVLVEDIYDISFWCYINESVRPNLKDKLDFPVPCSKGTRGKDILKKYKDFISDKLIICIDSDCEYLYKNNTWYMDIRYIYNTIVYSVENFKCSPLVLNEVCKDITNRTYEFNQLFEDISLKISPLFYLWIYLKKDGHSKQFEGIINNKKLEEVLEFNGTNFDNLNDNVNLCQAIEHRSNTIIEAIKAEMGESWYELVIAEIIPDFKRELNEQYEIDERDVLQFFYGHAVLEKLVEPLMKKVIELLKISERDLIKQELKQASEQVRKETIERFNNSSSQDLTTKITDSFKYLIDRTSNKPIEKIKQKLKQELST